MLEQFKPGPKLSQAPGPSFTKLTGLFALLALSACKDDVEDSGVVDSSSVTTEELCELCPVTPSTLGYSEASHQSWYEATIQACESEYGAGENCLQCVGFNLSRSYVPSAQAAFETCLNNEGYGLAVHLQYFEDCEPRPQVNTSFCGYPGEQ